MKRSLTAPDEIDPNQLFKLARPAAGFTLIELLVVIAVIAILASILIPTIRGVRESVYRAETVSQLQNIGAALSMFAMDHQNTYPSPAGDGGGEPPWMQQIAVRNDYLGENPKGQWMHSALVAPGVQFVKADGSLYKREEIFFTYGATGSMCRIQPSGFLTSAEGRRLSRIEEPARAILIFLSKQRAVGDRNATHIIKSEVNAKLVADLNATSPGDTGYLDFNLGGVMPVLMADGHVETVEFERLNEFIENNQWEGRRRDD